MDQRLKEDIDRCEQMIKSKDDDMVRLGISVLNEILKVDRWNSLSTESTIPYIKEVGLARIRIFKKRIFTKRV